MPLESVVWRSVDHRDIFLSEIAGKVSRLREAHPGLRGRDVAVNFEDDAQLFESLVGFDGFVKSITVVPIGLHPEVVQKFCDASGCSVLVTSSGITDSRVPSDECESRLDDADTNTRWHLATSGTTGTPKLISHSLASLIRSVRLGHSKGCEFRWGSLYSPTGFAGLQVFFQSWFGGSVYLLKKHGESISDSIARLIANRCNALSATPTMWRKVLMDRDASKLPLRQITLGGEKADANILTALRSTFPDAKIRHVYASSEAGVGFSINDGLPGFPVSFLSNPPSGVEIKIDADGMLWINPASGDQRSVDSNLPLRDERGFIPTGDLVERVNDRFLFLGRRNGIINVGGNKVFPEEVEETILQCDGVQLVRVFSKKSSIIGSLVHAEVVLSLENFESRSEAPARILKHCRDVLPSYKVPVNVRVVEKLDNTASGKLLRNER